MNRVFRSGSSRRTPRPSILLIAFRGRHLFAFDLAAGCVSYVGSMALRFDGPSPLFFTYTERYLWLLVPLVAARTTSFIVSRLYQRVWRYASVSELRSIIVAVATSSALVYGLLFAASVADPALRDFPRSIAGIETLLFLALVGGMRFMFLIFQIGRQKGGSASGQRTLIVGAGSAGVGIARSILHDPTIALRLVGFVDDAERQGHRLLGLEVLGAVADLQALIRQHGIGTVLFAMPAASGPTLRQLVRSVEREGARSLTVPSLSEVLAGEVTSSLRDIRIEDLLRRAPATIDLASIRHGFQGKTVLITGAGGSIGSELARQISRFRPAELYLLGRGENSIYEAIEGLREVADETRITPVIMDVQDREGIPALLRRIRPQIVFHAAAHKHVSFMERYPEQAIATNVLGTANLLEAAAEVGVDTFVFVSTDKAVRPTSVMGASKRVAELLVRETARRLGRRYVVVRFGNVLSSRGSVLPRFRRQLADGGPLTVTHPQVRRYFMTVTEAVQLILQAAALGQCGETFVLDMGQPVLIADLARDLIEMHGLVPGRDIQIEYTGLLPGEKLDEELFLPDETPRRTVHDSLWVADDQRHHELPPDALTLVRRMLSRSDRDEAKALLQRLVPEYTPAMGDAATVSQLTRTVND